GAFQGPHQASPPSFNLLTLGRGDKGTLDSEFYVAWWFDDRVAIRAGASHVVTELVTDEPLDDGNDRFRRGTTLFFVGASYRFGVVAQQREDKLGELHARLSSFRCLPIVLG